jgi:hypothetical protein
VVLWGLVGQPWRVWVSRTPPPVTTSTAFITSEAQPSGRIQRSAQVRRVTETRRAVGASVVIPT